MRAFPTLLFVLFLASVGLAAESRAGGNLDADEALARASKGDVSLIDVRSPGEWRQTGLPRGATGITIHGPNGMAGFVESVLAAMDGDKDRPLALICARGNRSSRAQEALQEAGFTQVLNVREGMIGGLNGTGWLKRGLPTESCTTC